MDSTASVAAEISENSDFIALDFNKFRAGNKAYLTWTERVNYFSGNDIDCVVNANILFYYSVIGREDKNLCSFLNQVIKKQDYQKCTNYYTTPYAFTYAVTRAFADANSVCVRENIHYVKDFLLKSQKNSAWGNDLENALAASSLINTGFKGKELDSAISKILARQNFDGSWNNAAFFEGYCIEKGLCIYFGSKELTTAISLEAIAKYKEQLATLQ